MAVKTYTYTSLKRLRDLSFYKDLVQYPHITATTDLARAIRRAYCDFPNVVSMDEIQKSIVPDWQDSRSVFQQYVVLGEVIRNVGLEWTQKPNLVRSFVKNRKPILNSIRFLMAAGAVTDDIVPESSEEAMFKRVWEEFETRLEDFCNFRQEMAIMAENPEAFLFLLKQNYPFFDSECVILHGFFYITPIQQRFIDMLEAGGKTIIYLCCMDPSLNRVQEIWESTQLTQYGFPKRTERIAGDSSLQRNHAFGMLFDAGSNLSCENYADVKIIKYKTELDFIRDVNRINQDGLALFSADTEYAEKLLKTFYPEAFKKRHLLSYPVGQYIYKLHSMWDANTEALLMDYEAVRACFASGWLEADRRNGRDLLHVLEELRPYFQSCRKPDDWKSAMRTLIAAKETLSQAFEAHLQQVPPSHVREHKLMANPFLNLSCFSVNEEDLRSISSLLQKLIDVAQSLFSSSGEIQIEQHLRKLRALLSRKPEETEVLKEEETIVTELLSRLSMSDMSIKKCMPEDIAEAIMLIIGSGILEEDGLSFDEDSEEPFIRHFTKIETAPLANPGGIHLCLADENRMPGKIAGLSWPLSDSMLENMESHADGRRKLYLHEMRQMSSTLPIVKRYLFYSLLQNERVEISWIEKEGDKTIEASPYVRLLQTVFNPVYEERGHDIAEAAEGSETYQKRPGFLDISLENMLCSEMSLDSALCRWRLIYGYLLRDHPSYRSQFHYSFALSQLIGAVSSVASQSKQTVSREVFALMPYYREIEKQQIEDYAFPYEKTDSDALDDISYPRARLQPHFLNRTVLDKAQSLWEEVSKAKKPEGMPIDHGDSITRQDCMYCPFYDDCPHAVRSDEL